MSDQIDIFRKCRLDMLKGTLSKMSFKKTKL